MIPPSYYEVWGEWFDGGLGRGTFPKTPQSRKRGYIDNEKTFIKWILQNEAAHVESYSSVQPFNGYEAPRCIEKIFYDFDNEKDPEKAGDEALDFKARLERFYDVEPIIDFSGNKGYHVWIYLEQPFGQGLTISQLKAVYNKLMRMLAGNTKYDSLDPSVVGDIKQLARIPYTHHQKTGKLCAFVDEDRNPIMVGRGFTKRLRKKGLSFELCKNALYQVGREEKERLKRKNRGPKRAWRYGGAIRPCIEAILASGNIHTTAHKMMVAAVAELSANGWGEGRIVDAFSGMVGFDRRETTRQVCQIVKGGYQPFQCVTIQDLGGCLGDACYIYRRRRK